MREKNLRKKVERYWNVGRKIRRDGPETDDAKFVMNITQAVQYLIEIKEHGNSASERAS